MTASDAESWAKLRLVEGDSSAMKWELVSSLGHTTLTVGSNSDCTWVVRAEGVRPIHFSLHWDGNTLRAADVYSAGDVRVDGQALTSQWKPLLGRSRVEFGRAAMVVEASAGSQPKSGDHPLESIPAASKHQTRSAKETLIGVAPQMLNIPPAGARMPDSSVPPGQSSPAGPSSSRPPVTAPSVTPPGRPANDRSMKATLVGGIGISPVPTPIAQQAVNLKANATLVGMSPNAQSASSVPQGRRTTQKGVISQPPGASPEAVAQAPMRSVAAEPSARINGAWQEKPDEALGGGRTLRGVSQPSEPSDPDFVPRAPRVPSGSNEARWGDLGERLSDIPTQMRDPASFESRRPRRGFPWRYVGVLVLTGVAYFAWLYLLDHM